MKTLISKLLLIELLLAIEMIDSRKYDEINQIQNYIGCFKDFIHTFECKHHQHHDVLSCLSCCYEDNSTFIGLKGEGRCFCGETFEWSSHECKTECLGSKNCSYGDDYNIFSVCEIGYHGNNCTKPCDLCGATIPCSRNDGTCLNGCPGDEDGCDMGRLLIDVNIAFKRPVKQSSNYTNGNNVTYPAQLAVDGKFENHFANDETHCTHTKDDENPWFYVDLGRQVAIKTVNITNRGDYGHRLSGVTISIFKDIPDLELYSDLPKHPENICNKNNKIGEKDINITLKCVKSVEGRYLYAILPKEHFLTICEIEVFAQDCTINKNCMSNEECQNISFSGVEYNRCICRGGYTRRYLASQCQDINECEGTFKNSCGNNTICTNIDGGYACSCKDGYRNDLGMGCVEVTNPVTPVVLACLFVFLVLVGIGLLVYFLKFHRKKTKLIETEKMVLSESPKEKEMTKIKIEDLGSYILDVVGTKTTGFADEFEKITKVASYTISASKGPGCEKQNRFANIVPYDYNRIVLKNASEKGHDYINASHIETGHKRRFIAAQGPKSNTADQFWQMIYEQNVGDIVMLTQTVEKNKNKCFQYWPDEDEMTFGEIKVVLESIVDFEDYIRRVFIVTSCNPWEEPKSVTQWQYMCWPDHGVPSNLDSFLKFHDVVVNYSNSEKMMLIHCSAGVGRTGCFIAIDMLLEDVYKDGCVDVVACVTKLREQRMCMVQSAIQYDFIYYALKCHTSSSNTKLPVEEIYSNVIEERINLAEEFERSRLEANFLDKHGKIKCKSKSFWISSFLGVTTCNHHHISYYPDANDIEDFWNFCFHSKCFVVILEDSEYRHHHRFLLTVDKSIITNNFFVECSSNSDDLFEVTISKKPFEENFYENKCQQISTDNRVMIQILIVKSDQYDQLTPDLFVCAKQQIDLLNMERVYKNLYIIGPSKSQLTSYFVACCDITDQMKSGKDVDVCKVVIELMRSPLNETITQNLHEQLYQYINRLILSK